MLFLDYDGTLVNIKNTPMEAKAPKRAIALLNELAQNPHIILTIVSGRKIEDLLYFLGQADLEKIHLVGSHGSQFKKAGKDPEIIGKAQEGMDEVARVRSSIARLLEGRKCFIIEDKKVSFSIHYRRCRKKDLAFLDSILPAIQKKIEGKPLECFKGKKVIEIKPEGIDKSLAIDMFADAEKKDSLIVCIGDDLTDEHLFLKNADGINVKVRSGEDFFQTSAQYYLKNVSDVHAFLKNVKDLAGKGLSRS